MTFTKGRSGTDAIADMKSPTSCNSQILSMNPGLTVADKWSPMLEAMAMQGYSSSSARKAAEQQLFVPVPCPRPGDWLAGHPERGQSYTSFLRGAFRARPHASYDTISLVVLGDGVPFLPQLCEYIATFFQCKVDIVGPVDINDSKNVVKWNLTHRQASDSSLFGGKQFYCGPLMDLCTKVVADDRAKIRHSVCCVGITMYDLTPNDDYNFVYGLASLAEGKGVFSMARFHPEFNGEKYSGGEDEAKNVIFKRCCRVVSHELSHIFGLRHCINYTCLMNGANHVGELERQPLLECPVCTKKLCCTWSWDLKKRYADLVAVCEKFGFVEEAARWKKCLALVV